MLLRVQIEHEIDQRAGETRAGADQHREARARDLGAALEVDDAERRPEVPVRLRREREGARRADAAHVRIVLGALPDRHARVRDVRDDEQRMVPALLEQIQLHSPLLDLPGPLTIRLLNLRRVLASTLRLRDLVGGRVLFALQPFDLGNQPPPARLERGNLLELACQIDAAIGEGGSNRFEVVLEEGGIDHVRRVDRIR